MKKTLTSTLLIALFYLALCTTNTSALYEETLIQDRPVYVPNEVIVKFKPNQDPLSLKEQSVDSSVSSGIRTTASQEYASIKQYNQSLGITNTDNPTAIESNVVLYETNGTKTVSAIVSSYNGRDDVEFVQPNYLYYPMSTPNDQLYGQMWGLNKIKMPAAWDKTTGSQSVKVAVIDTGIQKSHPDLTANIIDEKNFGCGGIGDEMGHGTHTNGTVGAVGNNGTGVTGVNWTIGLMSLKVFCNSGAATSSITRAVNYATTNGAKVINMSLGDSLGKDPRHLDAQFQTAIRNAVNNGTTVVVASGNCGTTPSQSGCDDPLDPNDRPHTISADLGYPSSDPNVITVSATTSSDQLATFSSTGSSIDVSAPGAGIASTYPTSTYKILSGTSMASPHVAGVAALLYVIKPSILPSEVKSILEATSVDLGAPGRDNNFGAGRIDAYAAVSSLGAGAPPATPTTGSVRPTPTSSTGTQPTVTQGSTPGCPLGDYDCNGVVDRDDLRKWLDDFVKGNAPLRKFEEWRLATFG